MDEFSPLAAPLLREELRSYLTELAADDPRRIWQQERREGLSSGTDAAFHFFFDDHDFDEGDIGLSGAEVAAIDAAKGALEALLQVVGDEGDDFVQHRLWPKVTKAAREAEVLLNVAH